MKSKQLILSVISAILNISVFFVVVVLIFNAASYAYDYGYRIFMEQPMASEPGQDVYFTIEPGDTVEEIARGLKRDGLIRDSVLFVWQEKVSAYHGKEKAGTFTLNTSQTPEEMLAVLAGEPLSQDTP